MNILPSMYIFKLKASGPKSHVIGLGCSNLAGVDLGETFARVVKFFSVRIMLATAAEHNLELHQMDVVTAFLHGEIVTDVHMTVPKGF